MAYSFGGYMASGYIDRQDQNEKKRLDVAREFEKFKKDNPYATAAELTEAVRRIAGPNLYLQQGAAGADAIAEISKRNREAQLEMERQRLSDRNKFMAEERKRLQEDVYNNFLNTGDINLAQQQTLQSLDLSPAESDYEALVLPDLRRSIEDMDLTNAENQFTLRYFKDNEDLFNTQISQGGDFGAISQAMPNNAMRGNAAFRSLMDTRIEEENRKQMVNAVENVQKILKDPSLVNAFRAGNLGALVPYLGRGIETNPEIQDLLERSIQNQQNTQLQAKKAQNMVAAKEYATKQSEAAGERMRMGISPEGLPPNVQAAVRTVLANYRPSGPAAASALSTVVESLREDDDISLQDARDQIIAAVGNELEPESAYLQRQQMRYMSSMGNPDQLTTVTAYNQEMYGDSANEGKVQVRVGQSANRVDTLNRKTEDYLGDSMNKMQGRLGVQGYNAHIADINNHIAQIRDDISYIDRITAYGEDGTNFLGTLDESQTGSAAQNRAMAAEQQQILMQQIAILEERKAQVEVEADRAQRRQGAQLLNRNITQDDIRYLAQVVRDMDGVEDLKSPYFGRRKKVVDQILKESGVIMDDNIERNRFGVGQRNVDAKQEQDLVIQRVLQELQ